MNAHPPQARLHDYLDGLLAERERRALESHLDACEVCRAELAAFQDLAARLAALPRAVPPDRDLRPGIHARIRWTAGPARASTRLRALGSRPLAELRYPLAAAALLLVALGAGLTLLVPRDRGAPRVASAPAPGSLLASTAAQFRALDARYTAAANELLAELELLEGVLAPETRAVVRENLRAIDVALHEARHALAADPGDPRLARLIMAAHEKKLDLLRRAAALSAQI